MTSDIYGYIAPGGVYIPPEESGDTGPTDVVYAGIQPTVGYNLKPFQYQIGGFVFGLYTQCPVSKVDIQSYNQNKQDFQIIRTNETMFGIDTLMAGTITFTMGVLDNYPLPNMLGLSWRELPPSLVARQGILLPALAKEWKALDVISIWGETKPLIFCDADGITRRIYGRPGKFQYSRQKVNNAWYDVTAEFRRSDTYAYTDTEYYIGPMAPGAVPVTAYRGDGNGDAWFRILLWGPFTNPTITYGGATLEINASIADGTVMEISSYPWMRRAVDSNGVNWRAYIIGDTPYLDELVFPVDSAMALSWTTQEGTETNADTQMMFMWRENTHVM